MTSTTLATPVPLSRDESGALLGQTMGLVAITAGAFALGAYIGRDASGGWAWLWFIATFAALLALNVAAERSQQLAVGLLLGFGLLVGLAVAPTVGLLRGRRPAGGLGGGRSDGTVHRGNRRRRLRNSARLVCALRQYLM